MKIRRLEKTSSLDSSTGVLVREEAMLWVSIVMERRGQLLQQGRSIVGNQLSISTRLGERADIKWLQTK